MKPTILVVFGATGDLMARKIAPSLFELHRQKTLPKKMAVVGLARRELTNKQFRDNIASAVKQYAGVAKKNIPKSFLNKFTYQTGFFENKTTYKALAKRLEKIDLKWKTCSNKLLYLAVPPEFYEKMFNNISESGLLLPCSSHGKNKAGWARLLVEKPFGKNLKQAIKLDRILDNLFEDDQVYRIDHYLAKETLQNIMAFRFSNNLLEDVWNAQHIEKIEIKLLEEIGIEGRGAFYDGVGALVDVGQNHLLQMLALTTMDNPITLSPYSIREKRAKILKTLRIPRKNEITSHTFRGQYRGYKKEKGVSPNSQTETYFKIKTSLTAPRWRGVPVYLESGKNMPRTQKEIIVTFRHPRPCLCPTGKHFKNKVIFRVQPRPGITVKFWSQKPSSAKSLKGKLVSKFDLEEQELEFEYPARKNNRYVSEYAQLLLDAFSGDQTRFVSSEETINGWKFIDPIIRGWRKNKKSPLYEYDKKSKKVIEEADKTLGASDARSSKIQKEIGIIGLGKMGKNMALRLMERGWRVVGYNLSPVPQLQKHPSFTMASTVKELAAKLSAKPKLVWIMVPHKNVDNVLFGKNGLDSVLNKSDIIIDGGNSFYEDSKKRARKLNKRGIRFIDVGVSGGPSGARNGASLMVGGDKKVFKKIEPLLMDLATESGYGFFPGAGAGHFVKMVHNGIEYGMMQSIAEGFNLMKKSGYKIDLQEAARVYNHGSVIESRLIGWLEKAFEELGENLKKASGAVSHSGEGKWTVETAKKLGVSVKVIEDAFRFRVQSRKTPSYIGKILTALRSQFGGHSLKKPRTRA